MLSWIAGKLGKAKRELAVYDPYFCNGAVIKNLAARGFQNVYNRNEDFYKVISENKQPDYDGEYSLHLFSVSFGFRLNAQQSSSGNKSSIFGRPYRTLSTILLQDAKTMFYTVAKLCLHEWVL